MRRSWFSDSTEKIVQQADPDDPAWPTSFFGSSSQYKRLLKVKDKYDPSGMLYGRNNVGSERWKEDHDGRLCRI
jgi:hypothetical protein